MKTIDKIITKLGTSRGAPMGRPNIGGRPITVVSGRHNRIYKKNNKHMRIYDCAVPMSGDVAYDKGGAYWGIGKQLRVKYNKDLSFVKFYRLGDEPPN